MKKIVKIKQLTLFIFLISVLSLIITLSNVTAYEIFYYHSDNLGSPIAITNQTGDVVWRTDYKPFGQSLNEVSENGVNNYQYNAKEKDDSGLFYYGARYYDSDLGRFVTADTIRGDIKNPQTLNRYVYTLNNPLKYVDPSGNKIKLTGTGEENQKIINWMNELTTEDTFALDKENFVIIKKEYNGGSADRKTLFDMFKDVVSHENTMFMHMSSSHGYFTEPDEIGVRGEEITLPLGKEGKEVSLQSKTILAHETAHARGFLYPGNKKVSLFKGSSPQQGEEAAVKMENAAKRLLNLDEREYYFHEIYDLYMTLYKPETFDRYRTQIQIGDDYYTVPFDRIVPIPRAVDIVKISQFPEPRLPSP